MKLYICNGHKNCGMKDLCEHSKPHECSAVEFCYNGQDNKCYCTVIKKARNTKTKEK